MKKHQCYWPLKYLCTMVMVFLGGNLIGQMDYYSTTETRYEDFINKESIHTVSFHKKDWPLGAPYIQLGSDQQLHLGFDDFLENPQNYYYEILLCDYNWKPADVLKANYIEGLPDYAVVDFAYSTAIGQKYIHYNVMVPNQEMKILLSGNYLLRIFDGDNPSETILTRRFMVFEDWVNINARVSRGWQVEEGNRRQQVDFDIVSENYNMSNPYTDMHVSVMQNNRWDNVITDIKPNYVSDNTINFDHDTEIEFWAGNEYRTLNLRSNYYAGALVNEIKTAGGIPVIYLKPDKKRAFKVYTSGEDINGRFVINVENRNNSEVDAQYAQVHFFLEMPQAISGGEVYLFGALTDWKCLKGAKCLYNESLGGYEGSLFLKQGVYNYEYGFLEYNKKQLDLMLTENCHWQTENEYTIVVYHRRMQDRHDRIVGLKSVFFRP